MAADGHLGMMALSRNPCVSWAFLYVVGAKDIGVGDISHDVTVLGHTRFMTSSKQGPYRQVPVNKAHAGCDICHCHTRTSGEIRNDTR